MNHSARLPTRGFAALFYVLVLSTTLLLLTVSSYSKEEMFRRQISRDEDEERAYSAARTCIDFVIRALTVDDSRTLPTGLVVHTDSSTTCVIDAVVRSTAAVDIVAHATTEASTARLVGHAERDSNTAYHIARVRDSLQN